MLTAGDCGRTIDRPENPGNQSRILKKVDPLRYWGGANELDLFLPTIQSNVASEYHVFPTGDPDQVKYAVAFLKTWHNHPDITHPQMENTEPAK